MPKLILKNFQNEKSELFYYDFTDRKIKKGHAKSLYTEEGYYSEYVEQFLSKEIEAPLGVLVKFLLETEFIDADNPPGAYKEIAFNYLYALLSRAPKMIEEINENAVLFQFFSELDRHNIAAHDIFRMAKEKNLLKEYNVAFLDNQSLEQLILPTGGVIQYGEKLVCPISPNRAIVFDKKDVNKGNADRNRNYVSVYEISSERKIHEINHAGIIQESRHNRKYVVGTNKEFLENIIIEVAENM